MKFKIIFSFTILLITFLTSSCSDEPSSLGIELIGSENISARIFDTSVDSSTQSSSFFKKVVALGNTDWILIGKYEDIKASSLLRFVFGLPDSLKEELVDGNINVLDSWINLTTRYVYTDSLASMNFTTHKVNSSWSSSSFTIDSLSKLNFDATDISSDFTITDTLYTFHIAESVTLAWMKNAANDTLESNYGIYLQPTDASAKVIGFQALTALSSEAAKLFVVIEKPGAYIDTLNGFINADISLVDRPNLPTFTDGLICTQSSVTIASKLKFNLDNVPPGVVINKAELFLEMDTIASVKGSGYSNTLRISYLRYDDSTKTEGNPAVLSFSNNIFSGDITLIVRNWINRKENYGLLIESGNYTSGLELFALKGSDYVSFTERPRIKITYTIK